MRRSVWGGLIRRSGVGVDCVGPLYGKARMPRYARVQPNPRNGSPTNAERYSMIDQWMVWNGIVWGGLALTASAMAYSVAAVRVAAPCDSF
jgi:choline-glycine betaine transporter